MPQINITVDNVSPIITYNPPGAWWGDYSSQSPNYFDQTSFGASTVGATASLSFYGSAIWLFGSKSVNNGIYNVTLDAATSSFNGFINGTDVYQTPIFDATGLTLGNHSVILTDAYVNDSLRWVDLDYIVWQTEIGSPTDTIVDAVIEDTEPAFVYQPQDAWAINPADFYSNKSGHETYVDGAYVTFTFAANAVELYGAASLTTSVYSVKLDNGDPVMYNANRASLYGNVLLYFATNLSPGNHTLKIANVPTSTGLGLSIDYAKISGTTNSPPSANTTISARSHKHGLSTGIIVAIVVSIAVGLFAVFAGFLILIRRRRRGDFTENGADDRQIPEAYQASSSVRLAEQSLLPGMQVTPFALPQVSRSEPRHSSVGKGASSDISEVSLPAHRAGAVGTSVMSLPQSQAAADDGNRDHDDSLAGHRSPPPDYKAATQSWSS